jgi:hypothetical protein
MIAKHQPELNNICLDDDAITEYNCQIQNMQCEILAQCIEDIQMNSKKYHISFLLNVINYSLASDIVKTLRLFDDAFAKRIVHERKKGIFESVVSFSFRTRLSRSKLDMILKANL